MTTERNPDPKFLEEYASGEKVRMNKNIINPHLQVGDTVTFSHYTMATVETEDGFGVQVSLRHIDPIPTNPA